MTRSEKIILALLASLVFIILALFISWQVKLHELEEIQAEMDDLRNQIEQRNRNASVVVSDAPESVFEVDLVSFLMPVLENGTEGHLKRFWRNGFTLGPLDDVADSGDCGPVYTHMEVFKATAYCSCEICCEEYAHMREGEVRGSSGEVLIPCVSVAVDTKVIPFGTELYCQELRTVFIAHDTGGAIKGNRIDIYWGENHAEALKCPWAGELTLMWND